VASQRRAVATAQEARWAPLRIMAVGGTEQSVARGQLFRIVHMKRAEHTEREGETRSHQPIDDRPSSLSCPSPMPRVQLVQRRGGPPVTKLAPKECSRNIPRCRTCNWWYPNNVGH